MEKLLNQLKEKWIQLKGVLCPDSSPFVINKYNSPIDGCNLIEVPNELLEELNNYIGTITYICVYATYITIKCDKKFAKLYNQNVYIGQVLDKLKLTRWDNRLRRLITICRFYTYDNSLCEFRLPRYALGELIDCIESQNAVYRVIYEKPYKTKNIEIQKQESWIARDYQLPVINWLSNEKIGNIRGTMLVQGGGKSFCAILTCINLSQPTLLICSGLLEQWIHNFLQITYLTENDIFLIQGHPSIVKLFKNDKRYKVYIASIETLRSWIYNEEGTYEDVPTYTQFLDRCNIGTKIIDEFHLNFNAIAAIDFRSNIKDNIYLSATPERNGREDNRIFNTIFPKNLIYANNLTDRYVNATMYAYYLDLPPRARVTSKFGYSHVKFESLLCSSDAMCMEYYKSIIKPLIDSHYINKFTSGKLLIFVQTVQMAQFIAKMCTFYYSDKITNTYVSDDPEEYLHMSDIIIGVPKRLGTGVDLKELVCCINTVSLASEPLVKQMFGRLRKLPDGRTPEYVDIYNKCIPDQNRHKKTRAKIYKNLAKEFIEFTE